MSSQMQRQIHGHLIIALVNGHGHYCNATCYVKKSYKWRHWMSKQIYDVDGGIIRRAIFWYEPMMQAKGALILTHFEINNSNQWPGGQGHHYSSHIYENVGLDLPTCSSTWLHSAATLPNYRLSTIWPHCNYRFYPFIEKHFCQIMCQCTSASLENILNSDIFFVFL